MAVPANTFQAVSAVNFEDLENAVYNTDPDDTPVMSEIGRGKITSFKHEWTLDVIASPNPNNAVIQGDDPSNDAVTPATQVGNFAQLSDKVVQVASSNAAVRSPDDSNSMAYQIPLKMKELKLDVDAQISQNKASVAPATAVAGQSGSFESWIETNKSRGSGGTDGGFNSGTGLVDAPGDGTQRALTEDVFKGVLQSAYENASASAGPTVAFFSPFQLNAATAVFTGIAQPVNQLNNATQSVTILASADIYKSPWGKITFKPSRNIRSRSILVLNPSYWKIGYLQPFGVEPLAKTGHSDRRMARVEYSLIARNEKTSGIVADLTTS